MQLRSYEKRELPRWRLTDFMPKKGTGKRTTLTVQRQMQDVKNQRSSFSHLALI